MQDYSDVILEKLPDGLPPKQDIQYHIDLILGESLPNQAVYRMSPTQHAELDKQVTKLIQNHLVQESTSPYAIPTLLNPKKDGTWMMWIES